MSRFGPLLPFHDLDAVAERIAHAGAVVALERFVINNREPGGAARLHDGVESLDQQSRMRFWSPAGSPCRHPGGSSRGRCRTSIRPVRKVEGTSAARSVPDIS